MEDAVAMTNFPGDAVKLETEILLNRFRCAAEIARLSDIGNQQKAGADDRGSRPRSYERELEEIERRIAETLERHRLLSARRR
jgi:hypothetical protein